MTASATEVYLAAMVARCDRMQQADSRRVDEPGLHGLLSATGPLTRLLVTDDRALAPLVELLPHVPAGSINVLATAPRCTGLLGTTSGWRPNPTTAMVRRDLDTVPALGLPSELTLRRVRRTADDPVDGVPLADAVAVAARADSSIPDPGELATYLSSLPAIGLFAAVDGAGTARATSGYGVFGTYASVIFVDTDPGWQRRGIGSAMTAAALRAAAGAGACRASLDASDVALPIYRRLGFEEVGPLTQFVRA
ncbi:MAG TPA: GNAT family N-acetyltransferase [Jatrophihabitans sp.]|jgi:GNAT superfamily N-acetyltransferase|uniref:GNAT family N-acetyltransferase n=1 Tax=Jatrophihabitans sp. TaxID=1932789 RepID=UPI002DFC630D|nr:GNAT family N-acetyltransferase [Jatrophihabitans sp.]